MASNWWDGDKVEGSGEFWSADEVVATTVELDAAPEPEQEVITSARGWRGAGAGRGSFDDPRRLDTAEGRRTLAIEDELNRLEQINTVDRESLRPLAEQTVSQPKAKPKVVDRVAQYREKGYAQKDAEENAAFDAKGEALRNQRFQKAAPDAVTGERIGVAYNPSTEAERVAAESKELDLQRRDAIMRERAQDMPGVVRGLAKGAGQAIGLAQGAAGLAGDLAGSDGLKEWGLEGYRDTMRKASNLGVAKQFTEIGSAGDALGWATENAGYVAFQAAQSILAGGMGGVIGSTVGKEALGTAVGLGLNNAIQTFGSVYAEAADEAKRTGEPLDMAKVLIGATVSTAVDTLADKIGLDSIAANGFKGNALSRLAKSTGMQVGVQGGTEMAQLVPEEWGAGRDPFRAGMLDQYINEGAVGALGGAGPGVAGAIRRDISDSPALALAQVLNEGQLGPVGDIATTVQTERARMEAMRAKPTVADIGNAASVDEAIAVATQAAAAPVAPVAAAPTVDAAIGQAIGAIATVNPSAPTMPAATRPVQLNEAALLQQAMAGIDQSAEAAPVPATQPDQPVKTWFGRRGDGYATPEDAGRALGERQRLQPALNWNVEQMPDGRYRLAGYGAQTAQSGPAAGVSGSGNTQGAVAVRNALQASYPTEQAASMAAERAGVPASATEIRQTSGGFTIAPTQPKETIRELRDQADRVQRLSAAVERGGDDASGLQLYTEPDAGSVDVYSAGLSGRPLPAVDRTRAVAYAARKIGRAVEVAFGWKPTLVTGLPNAYGVQFGGRVYVDVARIAKSAKTPNAIKAFTIQTIFHETTHNLEKSADPQDRKDHEALRRVVLQYAKQDVVQERIASEGKDQTYGENEVVADVSGDMALDPKFWARLYDLDNGSTMRRIVYKFMENATKLLRIAKGSRLDVESFIPKEFVDEVREVAAQVWASKAKRGGSLFDSKDQTVSKSRAAQSNFEVAPDPNDAELSARWNGLPLARKLQISREVAGAIVPEVLALRGAKGAIVDQFGSYLEDTNPSFALRLTAGSLQQVSMDLGYVLSQDSMMNLSADPFEGGEKVGAVSIELGEKTFDEISDIYATLRAAIPEIGGQSYAGGEMVVLNYSDIPTSKLTSMVDEALGGQYNVSEDVLYSSSPTKEEYDYASGSNDAGAQGQAEGGVRSRLGGLRAEATRRINDSLAYSKSDARGVPSGLRQRDADAGRGADGRRNPAGAAAPAGRATALPGYAHGQVSGAAGPDQGLVSVAEQYARDNGIRLRRQSEYVKVDEARAKRIADAYEQMPHAPNDPAVKEAYANLIRQTTAQYRALEKAGYRFWFMDMGREDNQQYAASPWNAMRDIRANKTMGVFPTNDGFGSGEFDPASNPLLADTGIQWPVGGLDGEMAPVLANDLFRAVHDAFGHGLEGAGFRAQGEENAWQAHVRLFTGSAIGAITSETRGQNSWLNYGPHGAGNQTAQVQDTVFADQKTGLMPEWTWNEGRAGDLDGPSTSKADAETDRSASAGNGRDRQGAGREADARESVPAQGGRAGGVAQGDDAPRYGQAQEGAVSRIGYHFSKNPRASLSGAFYGDGMPGRESDRLSGPDADDIRPRIFFYVDKGNGVMPESGVGAYPHHVQLDNLYDVVADPLGLVAATRGMDDRVNAWERAVLQAGFDGYLRRDPIDRQDFAVLLGARHDAVPVSAANPKRMDGQTNAAPAPASAAPKGRISSRVGNELRRRPAQDEVMEIIGAVRDGLPMVAPSFKMEAGEARVLVSEAEIADKVFAARGAKFHFGQPSWSGADMDDFNELGAFDLDAADIESYGDSDLLIDPTSADFKAKLQAELQAEMAASAVPDPVDDQAPNAEAIDDAGLWAEDAFEFSGNYFEREGREPQFIVPAYIVGMDGASIRGGGEGGLGVTVNGGRSERGAYSSFIKTSRAHPLTLEQIKAYVSRQAAGYHLHEMGHDIASAYRKNKLMQIANSWRQIAKVSGAFKLPEVSGSTDFVQVAKDMGAFKGYEVSANVGADGSGQLNFKDAQGVNRYATVTVWGKDLQCCTMGLVGGGGLGTEFYAVQAVVAKNMGKRFVADDFLSGINSYRRTEQAFSYALKSGDTGVILPGGSNRVYGYNENPKTQEDHDKNIARLALAGMRNVQELMPGMRRYSYDAATDAFLDARGRNADAAINELLAKPEARAFGLGRATVARAVLTSQIIKGDLDVKTIQSIAKPVAYSMADAELDQPLGEGWGEPDAGVEGLNPNLRRFMAGSKLVTEDGTPIVMYHGTGADIHAFRAKQAGAIFVTADPEFAQDFAALSADWMRNHWREVIPADQHAQVQAKAVANVMAEKMYSMTMRKQIAKEIKEGVGAGADYLGEAAADFMPSGENIIPVVVRATAPFDFRIPSHVQDVIYTLQQAQGADEGGDVAIHLVKEGGDPVTVSEDDLEVAIRSGMWEYIEAPEVQAVIRGDLGHDGFWVKESGRANLAVYQPSQIKSVFNHGGYSLDDDRLSYSRAALDGYIDQRNKTMPTVSTASQQEDDIALAAKAISAALGEMEGGSKERLPVPIGRVPHVLTMLGATNQMMHIDTAIVRKVLVDKHSEDFAGVTPEQFVRALYQPALVLRGRAPDEFEIITHLTNKNGPIIAPIKTNTTLGARPNIRSSAVMSAYARKVVGSGDSILNRIKSGAVLYADPVLAQYALTGRGSAPTQGIITSGAKFPSAPPRGAQSGDGDAIEFSAPSAGINALGAQFLRSPPAASRTSSVNQQGLQVKPLNPNFVGWDQVRSYILDGISQRKIKDDVALMRWIGDRFKGDWSDAPSFSRASGGFDLPEETLPQNARRKAQDFFLRAQVVQEAIAGQGGRVDEKTDFYRAEELSHGRMGSLLQDFATNQVQPLMEKLVSMGVELDELSLYAYAKHAPERNREIAKINKALPDGGSGMTDAEAAGILQMVDLSGDKAKFEELHADLMAISSTNRLAMLADGLITQDEFNALDSKYEHYIPLRGFEQVDESDKPVGRPAGRGFNIRGKETMRALGRRTRAGQLIENVIGDYQRTVVRGERNYVAKVFLNFVLSNPDPDLWEIDAQRTRLALDRQTGKVVKNTLIDKGEDTISVKVAGQEIYIKIKDPLLLRAMRKQHASDMGEQHRVLVSALGLYTTMLRNTLTRYNPEFALVNAVRDVGFGALAAFDEMGAGGLARFAGNYAGATAASFRSERNTADPQGNRWDRTLAEYKAAGGATSGFYAKDLEGISSDIRGMMIDAGAAPKDWTERARHNAAVKMVARFGRVLEFAGSVSENAARVAAYKTARDMGQSPSQAASIAKNLTTNFDRKGEWGATLNAAYVFFNAAVQGSHRTLKMFANPKVAGVLMGTAVSGVALALHAAAAGGDDPDDGIAYWDKIPAYVKERNLIIMLPPGAVMDGAEQVGTNGRYISIPVQYGLNIFPLLGYQLADVIRNQRDKTRGVTVQKAAIAMASAIAGSFNPLGGAVDLTNGSSVMQALAPSIFDPVIQGTTGTNGFGREVAPFKSPFDTKPDSQNSNVRQAGGPAEAVAQWLNRVTGGSEYEPGAIDLSPGTVENTVRNLTGGTGVFLYDVAALASKQIDEFNGEEPDRFTKDIPVWRRVRGDIDGDVDQGLFYESRRKIQEARGIQKRMEDSGEDVELTGEKAALASMDKGASKTTRALSKIRKQMAEVKRDPEISATERAVRIRELRAERDALVNEFNRDFMDTMRDYFEAPSGDQ